MEGEELKWEGGDREMRKGKEMKEQGNGWNRRAKEKNKRDERIVNVNFSNKLAKESVSKW